MTQDGAEQFERQTTGIYQGSKMSENSENIQVARISAIQTIAVALIAAIAGAGTTYPTVNNTSGELISLQAKVSESRQTLVQKDGEIDYLRTDLLNANQAFRGNLRIAEIK